MKRCYIAGCRRAIMEGDTFCHTHLNEVQTPRDYGMHGTDTEEKSWLNVQVGGSWYKTLVIQPVEYCQKNNLNMIESGVVKYVTRHRTKNGREDIEKAIHLLQMLLEMEYPDGNNNL